MAPAEEDGPHTRQLLARSRGLLERGPRWQRERLVWTAWLQGVADALDRQDSGGEVGSPPASTEVLSAAFDAFLVLADPDWWRAHPSRELSELEERRLGELREQRQRMLAALADGRWTMVTHVLHDAVETFFRAGYMAGLQDCLRLLDLMVEPEGAAQPPN